ncbi:prepilin peptidase [Candidatus Saccharibacteria bacterium]|nr:prepilin peptidase [Candidatus Saccharibacteria bacterium]
MEQVVIYIAMAIFGLCMGSYACATVWRLRLKQLKQDKEAGYDYDHAELDRLKKLDRSLLGDRSQCLNCSYVLKWYDMVPIFSWLSLGGRCRKCRKPIGSAELLMELGMMLFFVISYAVWPHGLSTSVEIANLIIWLFAGVALAILFMYDIKWFILPDVVNYVLIGLGGFHVLFIMLVSGDKIGLAISMFGSIAILSGIYWILNKVSAGKWIGFGDVKLGLGMGLILADWRLAFIALFAANFIGCLVVLPGMLMGKLKRNSHIPFGPLLIVGFVIAELAGDYIVNLYIASLR